MCAWAMVLSALGVLVPEAFAKPPKVTGGRYERQPRYNVGGYGWGAPSLSGTLLRGAQVTTTWFLYPGACQDRAMSTWVPGTSSQADSLNSYTVGTQGSYGRADLSLSETLWQVVDASTPASQRPPIPSGSRALWCGKYDASWAGRVGYPDVTNQILYIDLEGNRPGGTAAGATGTYSLSMTMSCSTEQNYDFLYIIGGGASGGVPHEDPLGNDRGTFDQVVATGASGDASLQATLTGSLVSTTPGLVPFVNGNANPTIVGSGGSGPTTITFNFQTSTDNRALYLLLLTDDHNSPRDGLWPYGSGIVLDDIVVSDNLGLAGSTSRVVYDEGTTAGGADAYGGTILSASTASFDTDGVMISARVFPGKGELWAIRQGNVHTTSDVCSPEKNLSTDRFFLGVDPVTNNALPGQFNSLVSCTFPVPVGTASLLLRWGEFLNMPYGSGYVQFAEYRFYRAGAWSDWRGTSASQARHAGGNEAWSVNGDELAEASQADSVQIRWNIQCIPGYAADHLNCSNNLQYAVLYDNLFLQVTSGVPPPVFGIFVGSVAQSTFVDGTMTGTNCATPPCWPGIRGTDLQTSPNPDIAASAVTDNFNSPIGDSVTISLASGLRPNGMGVNWRQGYDKSVGGGVAITHTNGSFNAAFDAPRMIYRLFDPATKSWSPFDSTELDADAVSVTGVDTVAIWSSFRVDWPPRDKAGFNLPGGFTINGVSAYDQLPFLPRGTRMQYYFKAVDINGGIAYQFSSDFPGLETTDLPYLPGGWVVAPDVIEFQVLPGAYPVGSAGSLLEGRTDTPILDLDGAHTVWSFQQDPMTQALRGLGVRADRYRYLQGYVSGSNVGGHELSGDPPARLSNFFPNKDEYGLVDSLATWYKIVLQSTHLNTFPVIEEADAQVLTEWAKKDTGVNGGDRCLFLTGDDAFNSLTNLPSGVLGSRRQALSTDIFGVANVQTLAASAAKGIWAGATSNPYPTVDDRFAAPSSGPGLASPGTFTYEVDGGCPGPNRFDPLTAMSVSGTTALASAAYPLAAGVTDVASVATVGEWDVSSDLDRTKALGYGYSIQFVRGAPGAFPRTATNYARSGVQNRMQILYKFLTSCRGGHGSGSVCWPCPTGTMGGNWNGDGGLQAGTYGPLYPIQDPLAATAVETLVPEAPPRANALLQNRPNPFNPHTVIPFSTAVAGPVEIRVFDVAGRVVRTLVKQRLDAGDHEARWTGETDHGTRGASGIYFYRIVFPDGSSSTRKMTILR